MPAGLATHPCVILTEKSGWDNKKRKMEKLMKPNVLVLILIVIHGNVLANFEFKKGENRLNYRPFEAVGSIDKTEGVDFRPQIKAFYTSGVKDHEWIDKTNFQIGIEFYKQFNLTYVAASPLIGIYNQFSFSIDANIGMAKLVKKWELKVGSGFISKYFAKSYDEQSSRGKYGETSPQFNVGIGRPNQWYLKYEFSLYSEISNGISICFSPFW